jgi:hypothetical protein
MVRAFLKMYSTPLSLTGWRGVPLLLVAAAIVVALPQARALVALGMLGGVVIGAFLILIRHQFPSNGPRRGTPIVLFPRAAEASTTGLWLRCSSVRA